jgi:hypothetical protein
MWVLKLAAVVVVLVAVYVAECWWFPFGRCWCCSGTGRHSRKDGKVWRNCWWCKGSARRLRVGRRAWNWAMKMRREARSGK